MSGVLAFLNSFLGLAFGWLAGVLTWLRKPGSLLKMVCAALAVALAIACLSSYRQAQQVVVITRQVQQCEADAKDALDKARLEAATLRQNNQAKDESLSTIAAKLQAEAEKLKDLKARNDQLRLETEASKAKAETGARAFQQQYDERPAECRAAFQAVAAACPALEGY